jgi:hypothetical protein
MAFSLPDLRQEVDQGDLGLAGQERVDVHFLNRDPVIFLAAPGNHLQPLCEFGDIRPAVRFEQADDHIDPMDIAKGDTFFV